MNFGYNCNYAFVVNLRSACNGDSENIFTSGHSREGISVYNRWPLELDDMVKLNCLMYNTVEWHTLTIMGLVGDVEQKHRHISRKLISACYRTLFHEPSFIF